MGHRILHSYPARLVFVLGAVTAALIIVICRIARKKGDPYLPPRSRLKPLT